MKKSIVVTGCNGGIGIAICHHFIEQGWKVFGIDIHPANTQLSSEVHFIQTDISQKPARNRLVDEVSDNSDGLLHGLVNNAAVQTCKPFFTMEEEEWDRVMDVNLKAPFFLSKVFYPLLKKASGAIVNMSSVHALATSDQIAAYASSKGGLSTLTRALAIECAKDNIQVNAIQPGAVDTEMLREGLKRGHITGSNADELVRGLGDKHIVKRIGKPAEIAGLTYYLIDQSTAFLTGQCLTIDGGATIILSTES